MMKIHKKKRRSADKHRPSWRGLLRFGLVSFPVQAYNAHRAEGGPIHFHQLHDKCHSRIFYEKHCPVHGKVDNDEIVLGYEYKRGEYVEIEPDELEEFRSDAEKALTIDTFIEPAELDPIYFDGRMYYLAPDGLAAREPYAVFLEALEHEQRYGIGRVVFSGKDQVVLIRAYEGALHMAMLNYSAEVRAAGDVVGSLPQVSSHDKKVRLAEQLIDSWSETKFNFSQYVDPYAEKVKELIAAKAQGREIVAPEAEEEPEVVNFMDALRKSVSRQRKVHEEIKHHARRNGRHRVAKKRRVS